jgi:hypothetical protein
LTRLFSVSVFGILVAPSWFDSAEAANPIGLQALWFAEPPVKKTVNAADPASPETTGQGPRKARESKVLGSTGKDLGAQRIENTANSLSQGGFLGVDNGLSSTDSGERGQPSAGEGGIPDAHVIQKGDSLWSLCSKYYGDPWRWPRLWAANPAITNPHWIFPGDVIRLVDKNTGEVLARVSPPTAASDSIVVMPSGSTTAPSGTMLRELGFIEVEDLQQAAVISGSREEKIMLSSGDQAYLKFSKDRPLRAGEQYTVFNTDSENPVKDPTSGQIYGYLVRIQGDLVVDQIASQEIARGTLTNTASPIERGARVSNYIRQFKRLSPKASGVSLQARVVASFAPNSLLGPEHFVVLNRGKRDGIEVGNRTFVIRQGDGYRRTLEAWEKHDPASPKEVVGEIWVVDVRDTSSVAWIARTTKELRVGEITEMRKGH